VKFLRSLSKVITRAEGWLLVVFLGTMIVFAFLQVVLRNFFGTSLTWGDILVRQMVMWAGFTGAAIATSEDRHISIDALTKFIPERPRHAIRFITNAFAAVVCVYLMRAAWTLLESERENTGELFLGIPQWVGLVIIPIGYALLTMHFSLNVLESGLSAVGRGGEKA
jgi:TRAP-type C4-dicarboxylate transport system permease small subunit